MTWSKHTYPAMFVAAISIAILFATLVLWGTQRHCEAQLNCATGGRLYTIRSGSGTIAFHWLEDYKRPEFPPTLTFHELPTPELLEILKKGGQWRDTDSWWEGIGWSIEHRTRFLGFEWASGIYDPPFFWRHRTVPFRIIQIPLWVIFVIASLLLCWSIVRLWPTKKKHCGRSIALESAQHLQCGAIPVNDQ